MNRIAAYVVGTGALVVLVIALVQFGVLNRGFVSYWYFHLPNFALAALMYTLLGRVLLAQFVVPDSTLYIWRFFCRLTDPVVNAVAIVTPKAAAPVVLWLLGFVWLFWLRVLFFYIYALLGLLPRAT